jgi:hypothetical protein
MKREKYNTAVQSPRENAGTVVLVVVQVNNVHDHRR